MKSVRVLAFVVSLSSAVSPAFGADLWQVYQAAQQYDAQFMAAAAGHKATLMASPLARDLYFPNASASANAFRNRLMVTEGSIGFNSDAWSLNISQPVFNYSYIVQNRQAKATVKRADAEYGVAQQDLMVRTSQAYFDVLIALADLQFAQAEKAANARRLEQAKKRFEVGMIAITDVHEAQASYDSANAAEIAASNAVVNAREALRVIAGKFYENLAPLGPNMPLIAPEPTDPERWTEVALKQNLSLQAATYASEEARQAIALQRAARYPTVDAIASYGRTYQGLSFAGPSARKSADVGLQLSVPFYQGGLVGDRAQQAAYQFNQAQANQEQTRRTTVQQTQDSYRGVMTGISQVKALKQAIVSNQSALDATEAGFQVGTRTIVDVLFAQQNLYSAKRDYARSIYNYILSSLRLKQAAGTLSPEDLKQVNSWLK